MELTRQYNTYYFENDGKKYSLTITELGSEPSYKNEITNRKIQDRTFWRATEANHDIMQMLTTPDRQEVLNRVISLVGAHANSVEWVKLSDYTIKIMLENWSTAVKFFQKNAIQPNDRLWDYPTAINLALSKLGIKHFPCSYRMDDKVEILLYKIIQSPYIVKMIKAAKILDETTDNDGFLDKLLDTIIDLIQLHRLNNLPIPNFDKDLYLIKREALSQIYIQESVEFEKWQSRLPFNYQNEQYEIIVPKSRMELEEIGQYFINCANGYEWNNFLSTKQRNLVVVKDKTKNEWVACVDFTKNGKIMQSLGKHNGLLKTEVYNFVRTEYADYLKNLFNNNEGE